MAKLAILGFGTVGSGVYEICQKNADVLEKKLGEPLSVGYICDVRDFSSHEAAALFVKDLAPVLADPEVKVVVETIGGATVAYDLVKQALSAGRSVATSNKELVAAHGDELMALAVKNGCAFLFEASVGGGIPVITPMYQCLAANHIESVAGIVNGTTNYMLTRMEKAGLTFEAALKEAQDLGYAETIDPSYDVDGLDAGRKIAILGALAFGSQLYPQNISTTGIRAITPDVMAAADKKGCAVKLVAYAKKENGQLYIGVEPMLIPKANLLAGVEDVFNAVVCQCDMLGEVLFYGRGAGKLPTASAVVADCVEAVRRGAEVHQALWWQPAPPIDGLYPTWQPQGGPDADTGLKIWS